MDDFDYLTQCELSNLLKPERPPSHWRHLAAKLGICMRKIDLLKEEAEPVIQLFKLYESTDMNSSIPAIYDACIAIERYDTLKHFEKFQKEEVSGKFLLQNIFFLFNREVFCGVAVK